MQCELLFHCLVCHHNRSEKTRKILRFASFQVLHYNAVVASRQSKSRIIACGLCVAQLEKMRCALCVLCVMEQ
jgi:hypothetical protein